MSTTLQRLLQAPFGLDDEIEMRPDRIGGGRLVYLAFVVEADGKSQLPAPAAGCLVAVCTETTKASSAFAGILATAPTKRVLRWLADSLDTDTPLVQVEVRADGGDTETVQEPGQRLAKIVFG